MAIKVWILQLATVKQYDLDQQPLYSGCDWPIPASMMSEDG